MIGDIPMRRFENQIRDHEIIGEMLKEIPNVNVGMVDGDYPYVVPMVFGYEITEDKLLVFLHSAKEGHKVNLWAKNPKVTLLFTKFMNHMKNEHRGFLHDYRSVMANGLIRRIDRSKEAGWHGRAVQAILRQSGRGSTEFDVPHYMFMDVYVVECDWKHVTAKAEDPIHHKSHVRLPELSEVEHGPVRSLTYDDWGFYFCRKLYLEPGDAGKAAMNEDYRVLLDLNGWKAYQDPLTLDFSWSCSDKVDADVFAIVSDENGKIPRRYDVAFYNQKEVRGGYITHMGDDVLNTKGTERLIVDRNSIPEYCHRIDFVLSLYEGESRNQTLKEISQMTVNGECVKSEAVAVDGKRSAVIKSLVRTESGWTLTDGNKAFDQWRLSDLFGYYQLAKWKE
ncbi:MAG: TerD family protein [Firmicutes bacterium]|nr:TerD family protein [Bacillota bacterium]